MTEKISRISIRNPHVLDLGVSAKNFLMALINDRVVTEAEMLKHCGKCRRVHVLSQYHRLRAMGFDIRRKEVSLFKKHKRAFRYGRKPIEVVYYI